MLRFHRWTLLEARGRELLVVNVSLVIGTDQEAQPEFVALVKTMENEVADSMIGPFPQRRN